MSQGASLKQSVQEAQKHPPSQWLTILDEQLYQLQQYHAQNAATTTALEQQQDQRPSKRLRFGNPASDGYDLVATVVQPSLLATDPDEDTRYSASQVMGKYLDLNDVHKFVLLSEKLKKLFVKDEKSSSEVPYADFLAAMGNLAALDETLRMQDATLYATLLERIEQNLRQYLICTAPLVDIDTLTLKPLEEFEEYWAKNGGFAEQGFSNVESEALPRMDLQSCSAARELEDKHSAQALAMELNCLGLKTDGSQAQRAERLRAIRGVSRNEWPRKVAWESLAKEENMVTILVFPASSPGQ